MPVDRDARDRLAKVLAAYMCGEVDNFALDDEVFRAPTDDPCLATLRLNLWCLYDDIKRHQFRGCQLQWDLFRRVLAFLQSDSESLPAKVKPGFRRRIGVAIAAILAILLSIYSIFPETPLWLFPIGFSFGTVLMVHIHFWQQRQQIPNSACYPFFTVEECQLHLASVDCVPSSPVFREG